MKLFSRRVQLTGPPAEMMAYAVDMCQYVNAKLDREIALWNALFGAPLGSMMYSTRVEGIDDLRKATDTLREDQEYLAKAAAGQKFQAAPSEDQIGTAIHGEVGDQTPPVGAYAGITTAQIANGKYGDALGWSVEGAQHVESTSGVPVLVLSGQYGPFGTVTWIGVTADAAGVDAFNDSLMADEGYVKLLDQTTDLFVPGSGNQYLATRIA